MTLRTTKYKLLREQLVIPTKEPSPVYALTKRPTKKARFPVYLQASVSEPTKKGRIRSDHSARSALSGIDVLVNPFENNITFKSMVTNNIVFFILRNPVLPLFWSQLQNFLFSRRSPWQDLLNSISATSELVFNRKTKVLAPQENYYPLVVSFIFTAQAIIFFTLTDFQWWAKAQICLPRLLLQLRPVRACLMTLRTQIFQNGKLRLHMEHT